MLPGPAWETQTAEVEELTETSVSCLASPLCTVIVYLSTHTSLPTSSRLTPTTTTMTWSNRWHFIYARNSFSTQHALVCVEDQLTEVPTLQRGVEVPSWREDKNHYNLLVQTKFSLKKSKDKETPTWRIKSTNPCYSMEGTEDIADQVLLKRHEKMEKDEKQRKRWDMQRMRQEQQLQKLRANQEKKHAAQSKKEETTSLLPSLEAATHICVEEKIPVAAFGRPIPSLPHTTFTLPWVDTTSSKARV